MKPEGRTSAADTPPGVVIVLVLPAVDMLAPDVRMPVGACLRRLHNPPAS
jgi:hypothetical protein